MIVIATPATTLAGTPPASWQSPLPYTGTDMSCRACKGTSASYAAHAAEPKLAEACTQEYTEEAASLLCVRSGQDRDGLGLGSELRTPLRTPPFCAMHDASTAFNEGRTQRSNRTVHKEHAVRDAEGSRSKRRDRNVFCIDGVLVVKSSDHWNNLSRVGTDTPRRRRVPLALPPLSPLPASARMSFAAHLPRISNSWRRGTRRGRGVQCARDGEETARGTA